MKQSILNTLGIRAERDIPVIDLFNPIALRQTYNLDEDDIRRLKAIGRFCHAWAEEKVVDNRTKVNGPEDAADTMRDIFRDLDHEEAWVLYLNADNRVIGHVQVSVGGLDQTVIDKRRIIKLALEADATAIILFHNHPSGNPKPSSTDIKETEKLRSACQLFDISVLDHIIVTDKSYYSFADESQNQF